MNDVLGKAPEWGSEGEFFHTCRYKGYPPYLLLVPVCPHPSIFLRGGGGDTTHLCTNSRYDQVSRCVRTRLGLGLIERHLVHECVFSIFTQKRTLCHEQPIPPMSGWLEIVAQLQNTHKPSSKLTTAKMGRS